MIYRKMTVTLTLAVLLLFGCKLNDKAATYTTTLEGIAIQVPSLTGGIINNLQVEEGEWISVGDTLAILDTRELRYQIEQIDASVKELGSQTKIALENVSQAQADYSYVLEKQQRTQKLFEGDVVPRQNLDDISNLLQKSRTMSSNASSQLEMLKATENKLLAQKKILLKKIGDAMIISPAAGKITSIYYRLGEAMAPFANLLELIDTRTLETKVFVPEAMLAKVKTGQQVKIRTEGGQQFSAVISQISNKAEFTPKTILTKDTRTSMVYAVTLIIRNRDDILKDGMPVEIEF